MTKQDGKFILFDSIDAFKLWLNAQVVPRKIQLIQNHHTWMPDYATFKKKPDPIFWMKSMEDFQVNHQGFAQIAQNFTTFPDGSICVGRPMNVAPAGILGANQFGVCIEHLGNFDSDGMTPVHRETIIAINSLLTKKFNLHPDSNTIVYHHWYDLVTGKRTNGTGQTKTCPGLLFFTGNTVEAAEKSFIPKIKEWLTIH